MVGEGRPSTSYFHGNDSRFRQIRGWSAFADHDEIFCAALNPRADKRYPAGRSRQKPGKVYPNRADSARKLGMRLRGLGLIGLT